MPSSGQMAASPISRSRRLDDRLDQAHSLSRWHFRPGTKNGEAIALEAVVQIPFRMKKY